MKRLCVAACNQCIFELSLWPAAPLPEISPRTSAYPFPLSTAGFRRQHGLSVRFFLKRPQLLRLTEARKAELQALAATPDSTIDFSDIPELDETFWKNAVRNPFYKPTKTHASVRIDSDVLAWLKTQGNGYQTRMNAILREAMIRALDQKV